MKITNLWGIFFSFWIPTIFLAISCYYAGMAEERNKKRVVHGKCNYSKYPKKRIHHTKIIT